MFHRIYYRAAARRSCEVRVDLHDRLFQPRTPELACFTVLISITGDLPELPSGRAGANGSI
eukprot:5919300-Pleurochrysis_carterae.AAC.1